MPVRALAIVAAIFLSGPIILGFASQPYPGTVKSLDMQTRTLTMEDGTVYALRPGFDVTDIKPGTKVLVTWGMYHATLAVDRIELVETPDSQAAQPLPKE